MTVEKLFVVTYGGAVLVNQNTDTYTLMPRTIEEADDRMFVHASDAAKAFSKLLFKTVYSDIVVIAVSAFHRVVILTELWIEFGVGKYLKYISTHELATKFRTAASQAFPFFHAISGCDTISSVAGKGKKSFYETRQLFSEITAVFTKMAIVTDVSEISEQDIKLLERFFVFLYSIHATQTT